MLFSAFIFLPVGGAFALSSPFLDNGTGGECQTLSAALGPAQQGRLRRYRASHRLSASEAQALNTEVCGNAVLGMIPALAAMITDAEDFEAAMGRLDESDPDAGTLSLLRAFSAPDRTPGTRSTARAGHGVRERSTPSGRPHQRRVPASTLKRR